MNTYTQAIALIIRDWPKVEESTLIIQDWTCAPLKRTDKQGRRVFFEGGSGLKSYTEMKSTVFPLFFFATYKTINLLPICWLKKNWKQDCFLEKQGFQKQKFSQECTTFFDKQRKVLCSEIYGKGQRRGKRLGSSSEYPEGRVLAQVWETTPRLYLKEQLITSIIILPWETLLLRVWYRALSCDTGILTCS